MQFDMSAVTGSFDFLMKGLQYSLQLTLFATAIGIFFGTLLAMARLSSIKPLNLAASTYVNLFRSVPLLLVIFWFYILVPLVMGIDVGAEKSAYITFAIFEAAYFCEIIRAGIQSIPRGQVFAGQAMGFTYGQNMRYVILPQAFRNVVPLLLTQIIICSRIPLWCMWSVPPTCSEPPARWPTVTTPWSKCTWPWRSSTLLSASPCRGSSSACTPGSPSCAEDVNHDRIQERFQMVR